MNELYEVMKMVDVMILFYFLVGAGFYGIISVLTDGVRFFRDVFKKRREKKKAKDNQEDAAE